MTMASVPSLPTTSGTRSGPLQAASQLDDLAARRSRTRATATMSSILPYAPEHWPALRAATQPPTVLQRIDEGK